MIDECSYCKQTAEAHPLPHPFLHRFATDRRKMYYLSGSLLTGVFSLSWIGIVQGETPAIIAAIVFGLMWGVGLWLAHDADCDDFRVESK